MGFHQQSYGDLLGFNGISPAKLMVISLGKLMVIYWDLMGFHQQSYGDLLGFNVIYWDLMGFHQQSSGCDLLGFNGISPAKLW